jgi:hypothetical protein
VVTALAPMSSDAEVWGEVDIDKLAARIETYCERLGGFVNTTPGLGSIEFTFSVESGAVLKFVTKASANVVLTFTKDSPGSPA